MIWRVCTLDPAYAKAFKKGQKAPLKAWTERELITANGYVKADQKAQRNHPTRVVRTYITALEKDEQ